MIDIEDSMNASANFDICPKYCDWQAWANSIDLGQMLQNLASYNDVHCLPLNQEFGDTPIGS